MAGQPTKLTPELMETVVADVEAGHYLETVATANGIHRDSLYEWLKRGERRKDGDEIYTAFSDAVRRAQARAEITLGGKALGGDERGESNGPAKCAMTWLERTRGKKFQPKIIQQVEVETSVFLDVAEAVLPTEMYMALMEAIEEVDDSGIPRVLSMSAAELADRVEH